MKRSVASVSFLLFSQGLAWEWPFLTARTPVAEPGHNIIYGACSDNGALVCNGATLFGTCNYGSVVYQSVAEGTVCKDGKIVPQEEADTSCPKDGALVCHGPRMYGFCKSGKVIYQPVQEGTWCQDGLIVGTGSQAPAEHRVNVPHSVVPYSTVPHSTVPHSMIPNNAIPQSTIYHSTIPHSYIPASYPTGKPVQQINDGQIQQPTGVHKRDETLVIANPVAAPPAVFKRAEAKREAESPSAYPGGGPTATIDAGVVHGTTTSLPAATATVNKYLGIPFAASPPVRFSPPQKPHSWSTPINATAYKPACIQQFMCK